MYMVFHIDSGSVMSYHESKKDCMDAIDQYNAFSGTFGLLEYNYKKVEV